MALTITATISVAEGQDYTPLEARIIAAMQAHPSNGAAAVTATQAAPSQEAAAEAAKAPAKRAPAKKPAPAPESAASTTPAVLDTTLDEPAAEPEAAADEDLVGADEPATAEVTLEEAVGRASELINGGKRAQVVAALKAQGIKKVGELKGNAEGLATFMKALA